MLSISQAGVNFLLQLVQRVIHGHDAADNFLKLRVGAKHGGIVILELKGHNRRVHSVAYGGGRYGGGLFPRKNLLCFGETERAEGDASDIKIFRRNFVAAIDAAQFNDKFNREPPEDFLIAVAVGIAGNFAANVKEIFSRPIIFRERDALFSQQSFIHEHKS